MDKRKLALAYVHKANVKNQMERKKYCTCCKFSMKNPFDCFPKSRGLFDSTVHQNSNNQQTNNAPVSAPPPASQLLLTSDHPTDIGGGADHSTTLGMPTAYPYRPYDTQQGKKKGGATRVFNARNNINMKGQQRARNIVFGNTSNRASLPINFPQNGGFIFKTGGNINESGLQEAGNIIVGNTSNGASLPINFPQSGRFIFNVGGNVNKGGFQHSGNIVIGNNVRG